MNQLAPQNPEQPLLSSQADNARSIVIVLSIMAFLLDVLRPALPNSTVDLLSEEKSNELIKPWLGNMDLPDDLPLPVLISIESGGSDMISPQRHKQVTAD